MPPRLLLVIAGTTAVAVGVLAVAFWLPDDHSLGPLLPFVLLTILRAIDGGWSLRLQRKEDGEAWQLGDGIFMVALLILTPLGTVLVFTLGVAAAVLIVRLSPEKGLFNAAQEVVAAGAGLAVVALFRAPHDPIVPSDFVVLALSSVAYTMTSTLAVAFVLAVANGMPVRSTFRRSSFVWIQWCCSVSVGLVAGVASRASSLAPLLALPPVAMVQLVLTEHFRARRDRERLDGLFNTAVGAHASVLTDEVENALYRSAARLLNCRAATIESRRPVDDEVGVPLIGSGEGERWLIVSDPVTSSSFDDEDRNLLRAIGAIGSSALENARLVEEIRRHALYDSLTGLANQALFRDRVDQALAVGRQEETPFGVVVVNLDGFKRINDSHGHSLGDTLLQHTANRLREAVREIDTVARLGGDHFTVLLPGVGTELTAGDMVDRLLATIREPLQLEGAPTIYMTASAGVAFYPYHGAQPEVLISNADSAMHLAKDKGRDRLQFYAPEMNQLSKQNLTREGELRDALRSGELRLMYQPQVELLTGKIVGVEALVRWEHPKDGLLGPNAFVPLAEESGLVVDIDEWVLNEACRQSAAWAKAGFAYLRMSVNLSGRHFARTSRLLEAVRTALHETGVPASRLEVEVTEGVEVGQSAAVSALKQLHALGVHIAIDDFGTRFSNHERIRDFPFDRLKIDRTFVNEVNSARGKAPILASMIAMAHDMGVEVVAEGVETIEQHLFLQEHGCQYGQGYRFEKPVSAEAIEVLLHNPPPHFVPVQPPPPSMPKSPPAPTLAKSSSSSSSAMRSAKA